MADGEGERPLTPQQERFYVYAVAVDGRVHYIGKGCGQRAWQHLKKARNPILRNVIAQGRHARVRILRPNLTEPQALALERRWIAKFKTRLTNISGGSRSAAEAALAECYHEWRCLMSEDEIRAEGPWNGQSVTRRLYWLRFARRTLARMILKLRAEIGISISEPTHG